MLDDSEYMQLEGVSDNSEMSVRLSLLSGQMNSRRVSSENSLPENLLQKSINETVERNPCNRVGLHQVGTKLYHLFKEQFAFFFISKNLPF